MNFKNYWNMKLNEIQFKQLSDFEDIFLKMRDGHWCPYPGAAALDIMQSVYVQVTGRNFRLNKGCSHCVMRLVSELGAIYFADLEERQKAKAEVKVAETETAEPVKVEVKTEGKKRRRRKNENS